MNTAHDPIVDALDRLARVADSQVLGDPMPGITRKARANRRRTSALTAAAVAGFVAAGAGVVSALGLPGAAVDSSVAGAATTSPTATTPTPTVPETPSPSEPPSTETPNPETSSPEPETEEPETPRGSVDVRTVPGRPDLVDYDRTIADVDGDGAEDVIRITFPVADANSGRESIVESDDLGLRIELASGDVHERDLGGSLYVTFLETHDLDKSGTAEVAVRLTGGGEHRFRVFTWADDAVVEALSADSSPIDLADGHNTVLAADVGLVSWIPVNESVPVPSEPEDWEVRYWTWELEGTQLIASQVEERHCMTPDQYNEPGGYPTPC